MSDITILLFGFSLGIIFYRLFIICLLKRIPETQKDLWELEYKRTKRERKSDHE